MRGQVVALQIVKVKMFALRDGLRRRSYRRAVLQDGDATLQRMTRNFVAERDSLGHTNRLTVDDHFFSRHQ
jgi:hypothetical protein